MDSFRHWIQQESWTRNVWDSMRVPDTPAAQIHNYLERLVKNSNDRGAWQRFLQSLTKLGKNAEAQALQIALKNGTVWVDVERPNHYNPKMGFIFTKIQFSFMPNRTMPPELQTMFKPVGQNTYTFEMEDPAKDRFQWPKAEG